MFNYVVEVVKDFGVIDDCVWFVFSYVVMCDGWKVGDFIEVVVVVFVVCGIDLVDLCIWVEMVEVVVCV